MHSCRVLGLIARWEATLASVLLEAMAAARSRRADQGAKLAALSVLAQAVVVRSQGIVDEVRNNYSFVQAGLSTLAAGASVALCLARGRLDSEMGLADLYSTTRFSRQNDYGAMKSHMGNNGSIIGVDILGTSNANTVKWVAHNTWVQGNLTTLVPFWSLYEPTKDTTSAGPRCTCWHIPSLNIRGTGRPSVAQAAATSPRAEMAEQLSPQADPQCYRVPSYQCELHGKEHMPDLHNEITQKYRGRPLSSPMLEGPSQLYQLMLEDREAGIEATYLFAVDRIGGSTLARMVSESLATLDSSQKGRTSDLVDWSQGKLQLSEKPDVKWIGSAAMVVLVGIAELVLLLLLACVFGLV